MDKIFRSYNSQLRLLRQRGLTITNGSRAKRILERENYYNLINGYKDLFLQPNVPNETYKVGANFFEIYALYLFDRKLRNIFLKQILKFENHIKSVIAYEFSRQYGHDNYLKIANFNLGPNNKQLPDVSDLIASIQKDIARQITKNSSVKHYMEEYGYVPMWVLVNVLTLGTVSRFFLLMKIQDRQAVAREFGILEDQMISYLGFIALIRNLCAHDERLYSYRTKRSIKDNNIHVNLAIPQNNTRYVNGKNDIFAVLIVLKIVLERKDLNQLVTELNEELDKLSRQLTTISINDVLLEMGFPTNWSNIRNI